MQKRLLVQEDDGPQEDGNVEEEEEEEPQETQEHVWRRKSSSGQDEQVAAHLTHYLVKSLRNKCFSNSRMGMKNMGEMNAFAGGSD